MPWAQGYSHGRGEMATATWAGDLDGSISGRLGL